MELNPNIIMAGDRSTIYDPNQAQAEQQQLAEGRFNIGLQPLKQKAAEQKVQMGDFELQTAKLGRIAQLIQQATPENYSAIRQQALTERLSTEDMLPQTYDPAWIEKTKQSVYSAKDKLDMAKTQAELAKLNNENLYTQSLNGGMPSMGAAPMSQPLTAPTNAPLSIRNNNPLNITDPATGAFRTFNSYDEGMRAAQTDLTLKVSGNSPAMRGQEPTLANVISVWSPANGKGNTPESTQNYINYVAQNTGINPNQRLTVADVSKIAPFMANFEAGTTNAAPAQPVQQTAQQQPTLEDASKYSVSTQGLIQRYNTAMRFGKTQEAESFRKMLENQPDYKSAQEEAKKSADLEVEIKKTAPQANMALNQAAREALKQLELSDRIIAQLSPNGTGRGAVGVFDNKSFVPTLFQDTADASADIDQLDSSNFLAGLTGLKAASPTGATGLGATTEREGEKVQKGNFNFDKSQGEQKFIQQVNKYKNQINDSLQNTVDKFNQIYGTNYTAKDLMVKYRQSVNGDVNNTTQANNSGFATTPSGVQYKVINP